MILDLNKSFPLAKDGSQGPLPKQAQFMGAALDKAGPKYICYAGGVGSGKTLIGCMTVLTWAVIYGGDYLIARQYYPELKITTLKTFKEICPPELIIEERVADGIIILKTATGKPANIIFRQLEEPDKLRSLNLAGAYIDEASQVSEAAFMLLQGRLRGQGLRKLIMTTNPNGHDWIYRWFIKQDHFTREDTKQSFLLIKAPSTENIHLPEGYVQSMMDTWTEDRVRREIYGDFDSFSGQVYSEFRQETHVVKPFVIPETWERVIGIDHGYRNPACWLWGAVDYDGNVYVYREFYEKEWLIEEIVKGDKKKSRVGVLERMEKEKIQMALIDPSTRARRGTTGLSDYDEYVEHLPQGFALCLANNTKTAGIDKVKGYFKLDKNNKAKLYIFNTCTNLIDELSKYRYAELPVNDSGKKNEKEEPLKVNDHACDALRYLVMSRPDVPKEEADIYKTIKYASLEGSLYRDLQKHKNPEPKDPFEAT